MALFKKEKQEKLGFDLQNNENQKALIRASLNYKIPLINKGRGVFLVDTKHTKDLEGFLKEFMDNSTNCKQGVIDRNDPKTDYILIYDKED